MDLRLLRDNTYHQLSDNETYLRRGVQMITPDSSEHMYYEQVLRALKGENFTGMVYEDHPA